MDRTYERAIETIDSRNRVRRPDPRPTDAVRSKVAVSPGYTAPSVRGNPGLLGMAEWLQQIGHSADEVNNLKIIHVAGTKGKGSTCSFAESFLRAHGKRTRYPAKTGMYTSPHLIYPEERIRLNGVPIDRSQFATYFFELWDRLPQLQSVYDSSKGVVERGPRTLQLYALLAFHVFIREEVQVAIFETHSGGEYDATNVIERPVVTAVTTLGMDHISTLGPTIENIAWHKAGIFKSGAAALSTTQDGGSTVERVLNERAAARGEAVRFVGNDDRLSAGMRQLEPAVQRQNASLALAAAEALLDDRGAGELDPSDIRSGVEQWSWPGRFQIVRDIRNEHCTWYLDAAHNDMSVVIAARWFATQAAREAVTILIFSHINELRDSVALLKSLATALRNTEVRIDHVVFTSYDKMPTKEGASTENDDLLREVWHGLQPNTRGWWEPSIDGAVNRTRSIAAANGDRAQTQVLITGSQHLVGPALNILQP
ncbi:hypothetical protein LTR97_005467 [Elasticomyces elasticus]|uniref:tetrahydrofolate synthase n=1 Tax=Elasticomyces elasticus TaxID=574655 RepID=A0AAN7ZNV6_9PEZI|nr:hypothetical protein LTR97_005467 [Elasticomyces elasticus]